MHNDQQYEQLMLLYNQLKNGSEDIFQMLEKEDYDGAITMLKTREPVLLNCKCIRNYLELSPEQETQVNTIVNEIKELEKRNMEFLKKNMNLTEAELKSAQKTEKIQNAYEFNENNSGNIINVQE